VAADPLISVVMSVFNGERFLREAMESILNQSFRDFELIVIDDGSTDGSAEILSSFAGQDSRVQVHWQPNRGLVEALNRGFGLARGKYIARMDADDIAVRDRLLRQSSFLERNPEVGVVGGAIQRIDSAGKPLEVKHYARTDAEIKAALFRNCSELAHPAVLIRKEVFVQTGGYRAAFVDAEDYDLWLRIAEHCQLANLDEILLKYRVHPAQVTRTKLRQQALSVLAAKALAVSRKHGGTGEPSWQGGVTAAALCALGVDEATQQSTVGAAHLFWIKCLSRWGQNANALELAAEMSRICQREHLDRWVVADTNLALARIYWSQKKFARSIASAAHGVITWPLMLARPMKPLLRGLQKALQTHSSPVSAAGQ
jgi:hypothetical protein